jgi:hypothetical protein
MEPTYNPVDQTFIAARVPTAFKERIEQFSTMNDISVSQIIRKGIKKVLEESGAPSPVGGWSVRQ